MLLLPVDVFLSAAVLSSDDLSEDLSDAVFALSELSAAGVELSLVSDCVPLFCLLSLSTTFVSFNASFFTSSSVSLSATISCVFSVTLTDLESFFFPFSPDFELTATAIHMIRIIAIVTAGIMNKSLCCFSFFILYIRYLSINWNTYPHMIPCAVFAGYPDMHIIHTIIRKAKCRAIG